MRKSCFVLFAAAVFLPLVLAACGQPGYLPGSVTRIPDKGVYYLNDSGKETFRKIETIVYIDVSQYNPLNAGDYAMAESGIPFFDYVILGDAYIMQDSHGYYLKFSKDLKALLEKRWEFVVPLQKKGIQVLLSITSAENGPSLGNMDLTETNAFIKVIYDTLTLYRLDGVEYNDIRADPGAYPDAARYDPQNEDGFDERTWLIMEWLKGGCTISNLCYLLDNYIPRDEHLPIMVRNSNYGAHLPDMVPCTTMIADVASTMASIITVLPSRFDVFNERVNIYGIMGDGSMSGKIKFLGNIERLNDRYTALAVDLDGKGKTGDVTDNFNLFSFFEQFRQNNFFQTVFFSNLKPVSDAKNDSFYDNPFYDPLRDKTGEDALNGWNPEKLSQRYLFNNFTTRVMQQEVTCTGGDRQKEW